MTWRLHGLASSARHMMPSVLVMVSRHVSDMKRPVEWISELDTRLRTRLLQDIHNQTIPLEKYMTW